MKTNPKNHLLANIAMIITAVLWGGTFFITRESLRHVDAVALLGYRSLLSVILLFSILVIVKKKNIFRNFKTGFALGSVLYFVLAVQTIGLYFTSAVNSGFIAGMTLLFIPGINYFVWRKKLTLENVISISVAIIGLWFITGGISGFNRGDLLTLISTAVWAVYILMIDKNAKKSNDALIINFQQWLTMAFWCGLTVFIFRLPIQVGSMYAWYTIGYLAVFATIIAYGLQFYAQRHISSVNVSILLLLEPASSAIFAWTLGNEAFNWLKLLGCGLVLIAILLSEIPILKFVK